MITYLLYSTTQRTFNNDDINVIEFVGNRIFSQRVLELNFLVNKPMALCGIDFSAGSVQIQYLNWIDWESLKFDMNIRVEAIIITVTTLLALLQR